MTACNICLNDIRRRKSCRFNSMLILLFTLVPWSILTSTGGSNCVPAIWFMKRRRRLHRRIGVTRDSSTTRSSFSTNFSYWQRLAMEVCFCKERQKRICVARSMQFRKGRMESMVDDSAWTRLVHCWSLWIPFKPSRTSRSLQLCVEWITCWREKHQWIW